MGYDERVEFGELQGKTLIEVRCSVDDGDVLWFVTDGGTYKMYHQEDCCEYVRLEDVVGSLVALFGAHITVAEETSKHAGPGKGGESETWTFYKLQTPQGDVTLRWLGESNGYYSESVDIERMPLADGALLWDDNDKGWRKRWAEEMG